MSDDHQCRVFSNTLLRCTLFNTHVHHVHESGHSLWSDCGNHDCVMRDPIKNNAYVMCHSVDCMRRHYAMICGIFAVPVAIMFPDNMRNRYPDKSLAEIVALRKPSAYAEYERHCKILNEKQRQVDAAKARKKKKADEEAADKKLIRYLIRKGYTIV
jgi:hypothetical protein